ncbi:hypothetical protein P2P98_03105 [Microbacterium sp. Kw_RZR3]|uniref:hypothetical protein n=1 Tax=Microbacterium sp. Kw_RZR3 TaxID=3032903 RepID=UPI0023DB56D0|nr:hypothetical protein [Microbacterium sp. Kw_RZR3]MDF2045137.1 hypothetical protein [Microbacterium sp. Kw_RZR3]
MDDVTVDRARKRSRAGTIFGGIIAAILVTAVTALVVSGIVWAIVTMWRSILG